MARGETRGEINIDIGQSENYEDDSIIACLSTSRYEFYLLDEWDIRISTEITPEDLPALRKWMSSWKAKAKQLNLPFKMTEKVREMLKSIKETGHWSGSESSIAIKKVHSHLQQMPNAKTDDKVDAIITFLKEVLDNDGSYDYTITPTLYNGRFHDGYNIVLKKKEECSKLDLDKLDETINEDLNEDSDEFEEGNHL